MHIFLLDLVSHPVWVRGLKPELGGHAIHVIDVAPRVGAWIETNMVKLECESTRVAPRVGAWIETCHSPCKRYR